MTLVYFQIPDPRNRRMLFASNFNSLAPSLDISYLAGTMCNYMPRYIGIS